MAWLLFTLAHEGRPVIAVEQVVLTPYFDRAHQFELGKESPSTVTLIFKTSISSTITFLPSDHRQQTQCQSSVELTPPNDQRCRSLLLKKNLWPDDTMSHAKRKLDFEDFYPELLGPRFSCRTTSPSTRNPKAYRNFWIMKRKSNFKVWCLRLSLHSHACKEGSRILTPSRLGQD